MFHSTIKLTVAYSKEEAIFLDVNIKLMYGEFRTDLLVKFTDTHQFRFYIQLFAIFTIAKREYLTVKSYGLTEFVQIKRPLIDAVMI